MPNYVETLKNRDVDPNESVLLYEEVPHKIYWISQPVVADVEEVESNVYLIVDEDSGYLIDPGGYLRFSTVLNKLSSIINPQKIKAVLFSHQDPDVCASLQSWLAFNPAMTVVVHTLWRRFVPHYTGAHAKNYLLIKDDEEMSLPFPSGGSMRFINAPFLHAPGNFHMFDEKSGFYFSGDLGAAVPPEWVLFVDNFEEHKKYMLGFHRRYMASNKALRGWLKKVEKLEIQAIVPQHGQIFRKEHVPQFFKWLSELKCGTDVLYPEL